jgi:beta-glucosidase
MALSAASIATTGTVDVSFDLTNVGDRAGDEVAQLYTHQKKSRSYQPIRTLRAFRRVTLQPNETKRITLTLPASQLAWYQGGTVGSAVEPGVFDVGVGASSDNIRLRAPLTVTAAPSRSPARP